VIYIHIYIWLTNKDFNSLQHTATPYHTYCCNTLQYAATHCHAVTPVLPEQHQQSHEHEIEQAATHCNTLQHTFLQHAAIRCNTPRSQDSTISLTNKILNKLQHIITNRNTYRCNTLQNAATHCNTPSSQGNTSSFTNKEIPVLHYFVTDCNTCGYTKL